jgi:hypothetical protein
MPIELRNGAVHIDEFRVSDPAIVGLVAGVGTPEAREQVIRDALLTGARGMLSMGFGIRVDDLDTRLRTAVEVSVLEAVGRLDKAVTEATRGFEAGIDLGRSDSHTTRLLKQMEAMFAPEGPVLSRLRQTLDPTGNSPFAATFAGIQSELARLRDDVVRQMGRAEEAQRGTAKGVEFEERLDRTLRQTAKTMGAIVEYTARSSGATSGAMVGDYLITLADGCRVVVEVKSQRSISLMGKNGILSELDRAIANRDAQAALCISAEAAYPEEVGAFGVYGNRVLVVDDGEGTMITAALRWISAALAIRETTALVDLAPIHDGLQRLRTICQRFSSQRSALTDVTKSVDKVSENLADMRNEVLALVEDLLRHMRSESNVVELPRAAS